MIDSFDKRSTVGDNIDVLQLNIGCPLRVQHRRAGMPRKAGGIDGPEKMSDAYLWPFWSGSGRSLEWAFICARLYAIK